MFYGVYIPMINQQSSIVNEMVGGEGISSLPPKEGQWIFNLMRRN
jgi:hypothetical protein